MIARSRTVRDTRQTAVRSHIAGWSLPLTQCLVARARIIFQLILLGSASCVPGLVLGQAAADLPLFPLSSVTLKWDKSTGREVKGYRIHYGTAPGKYPLSSDVGKKTTCKISNLIVGKKYYFVVAAYNARGRESLPSNECSFVVLPSSLKKRS